MAELGHILVVCTGNICRSPMGAALLQHALAAKPEPLRSIKVISAGVAARRGEPASANAVAALKKVGIDLKGHVSRPVTQELLDKSLMVLCMTEGHRDMIEISSKRLPAHLHLYREFVTSGQREVADPYGMPVGIYEACRDELVEAIPSLVAKVEALVAGEGPKAAPS